MNRLASLENRFQEGDYYLLVSASGARLASREVLSRVGNACFGTVIAIDLRKAYDGFRKLAGRHKCFSRNQACQITGLRDQQFEELLGSALGCDSDDVPEFSFADAFVLGLCGTLRRQGAGWEQINRAANCIADLDTTSLSFQR